MTIKAQKLALLRSLIVTCLASLVTLGIGSAPALAVGVAPTVEVLKASAVTQSTATLEAQVNSVGEPTTKCVFEYGKTAAANESSVGCEQGEALEGEAQPASVHLTGLRLDTKYYYKLIVENATGKAEAEGNLTTLAEHWGTLGVFGSEGSGPGQFKEPTWLASDPAAGVIYVVDAGNNRVERFTTTG